MFTNRDGGSYISLFWGLLFHFKVIIYHVVLAKCMHFTIVEASIYVFPRKLLYLSVHTVGEVNIKFFTRRGIIYILALFVDSSFVE